MTTADVLVFSGGALAITGGLIAILTSSATLPLILCGAGAACVLTCFYIDET